jgi:hypothetical protein
MALVAVLCSACSHIGFAQAVALPLRADLPQERPEVLRVQARQRRPACDATQADNALSKARLILAMPGPGSTLKSLEGITSIGGTMDKKLAGLLGAAAA